MTGLRYLIAFATLLPVCAAASPNWQFKLLLAGAYDSLEVTLVSQSPLPLKAAQIEDWLELPEQAGCTLTRPPEDVPESMTTRPESRYVWEFECEQLNQLTTLTFHVEVKTGKLDLQWSLPIGQGHTRINNPIYGFDFESVTASPQDGGSL